MRGYARRVVANGRDANKGAGSHRGLNRAGQNGQAGTDQGTGSGARVSGLAVPGLGALREAAGHLEAGRGLRGGGGVVHHESRKYRRQHGAGNRKPPR